MNPLKPPIPPIPPNPPIPANRLNPPSPLSPSHSRGASRAASRSASRNASRRSGRAALPAPGRSAYGVATAVALVLIPVAVLAGGDEFRDFLNFGAGVLSLVSLTCSVVWGLVAQDRIFLTARQRLVGQAVHRTTAVASIAFLLLHITVKLALDHVGLVAVVIPFSLGVAGSAGLIGLGSAAGLLMVFVGLTGALRSAFASPAPIAARWRAMHALAYPAWCAALLHGLFAGREADTVFVVLYLLCVAGVAAALALRAAPRPVKRRVAVLITAFLGSPDGQGRDELGESGARTASGTAPPGQGSALPGHERPLPGYERATAPDPAGRPSPTEPAGGFAAAYRAVSRSSRPPRASRASRRAHTSDADLQPTEPLPRTDAGASAAWPVPSPPPVGEAPPSAYDPLQDTGHTIPAYGDPGFVGHAGSDPRDTVESNTLHGTYHPDDMDNSGPTTAAPPGASYDSHDFEAPGSGDPWTTPSGGLK